METVIAALISAFSAIAVCLINSASQHKKLTMQLDKHNAMQAYRIEQLEKKVEKHNSVVDRTYKLEKDESVIQEKIKVINHRIEDLETENKGGNQK